MDFNRVLEEYGAAFTEAVRGRSAEPVPSCPGWTVEDLVAHLTVVQAWWTEVLLAGGPRPDEAAARAAADVGSDPFDSWLRVNARYLAVQRDSDPDGPAWTWWNPGELGTAAEVASRQVHEAVVHCWDARAAAGRQEPVPAAIAADGVDEFLSRLLVGPEWHGGPVAVGFRATDADRTWLVATDGTRPPAVTTGVEPTSLVTGTAEELYLVLWGRFPVERAVFAGDADAAHRVLDWQKLN
ncbi:maleylpyruvate isomerase family mycothiol-dependent enzyme [Actinosynnema sp. NPDC020468]|uniref:maleylpyruvate isomerase family mycothiol-dependent enzyme n=1 Tax=Actinosynnema sp. NPDC020468 TaxID=3154488 RepID=UPI00340D6980